MSGPFFHARFNGLDREIGSDFMKRCPQLPNEAGPRILGFDLAAQRPRGLLHEYGVAEPFVRGRFYLGTVRLQPCEMELFVRKIGRGATFDGYSSLEGRK